ncbi:MAG: M3 family oligoendopeptidase, partial [Oscillospiraceae bacterium]|nr:M3 family oligoendopeptidase [Oscillospiraceae bacterium]
MKFKDMPYERVNLDEFKTLAEAMKLRLSHADSAETAASAFEEFEAASVRAATEFELAFIRNSLDTTDEYYAAEQLFCDGVRPLFSEIVQDFTKALLESRFRAELESKWGSVMFLNAEIGLKAFS